MPTREEQTTIPVHPKIKQELEVYKDGTWDEMFLKVLILIEQDANS